MERLGLVRLVLPAQSNSSKSPRGRTSEPDYFTQHVPQTTSYVRNHADDQLSARRRHYTLFWSGEITVGKRALTRQSAVLCCSLYRQCERGGSVDLPVYALTAEAAALAAACAVRNNVEPRDVPIEVIQSAIGVAKVVLGASGAARIDSAKDYTNNNCRPFL